MKSEFLQPRFDGPRFSEHTLPLEVTRDLAAYEALVIELAKHLFLKDHPERQRVPKGFDADFHLHLEKVDEGSAKPLLAIVASGILALDEADNAYFARARDLITECVAAPDGQLPERFPRHLLNYFNQVGRSLKVGESLEFSPNVPGSVLTPDRRKRLVLAADKVYERELELSGVIGEADWEKSTFRMRLMDGTQAVVPMPESFHANARLYGGRPRHQVTVKGVGSFDSWDRLQKIVSVESLEVQPNFQLAFRFEELSELKSGWFDGEGQALPSEKLAIVSTAMVKQYSEKVPLPAIVPTPEGNILFEWNLPGDPSVDFDLENMKAYFHAFHGEGPDIEQEFDVQKDNWQPFFAFLADNLEIPA